MVPGTTEMAPAALYGLPPEATKEPPHERDQLTSDCQLPPVTVMPLVMAGVAGGGLECIASVRGTVTDIAAHRQPAPTVERHDLLRRGNQPLFWWCSLSC